MFPLPSRSTTVFGFLATLGALPRKKFAFFAKCVVTTLEVARPSGVTPKTATSKAADDSATGRRFLTVFSPSLEVS